MTYQTTPISYYQLEPCFYSEFQQTPPDLRPLSQIYQTTHSEFPNLGHHYCHLIQSSSPSKLNKSNNFYENAEECSQIRSNSALLTTSALKAQSPEVFSYEFPEISIPSPLFNQFESSPLKVYAPHLRLDEIQSIYKWIQFYQHDQWEMAKQSNTSVQVHSSPELPRSLVFTPDRKIVVLLNRTKKGDSILGEGSYKKVTLAVDITGSVYASFGFKEKDIGEMENLQRFVGIQGIIQMHFVIITLNKKQQVKQRPLVEFCDMGNLADAMENRILTDEDKKSIFLHFLYTMHRLHSEHHCVHRDLKPSNILLKKGSNRVVIPVLGDLGSLCDDTDEHRLNKHVTTSLYASPEYVKALRFKDNSLSKAAKQNHDMWAVGCIGFELFEMGTPPWHKMQSENGVLSRILTSNRRWFKEPKKKTPQHLVWQIISFNVEKRPTIQQIIDQLPQICW